MIAVADGGVTTFAASSALSTHPVRSFAQEGPEDVGVADLRLEEEAQLLPLTLRGTGASAESFGEVREDVLVRREIESPMAKGEVDATPAAAAIGFS